MSAPGEAVVIEPNRPPEAALTAAESIVAVMERLRGLGKHQQNDFHGFRFRGIDDVMNAVGPVLRDVGAVIVPRVLDVQREKGGMNGTVVTVEYRWIGPDGSDVIGSAVGEAFDKGDKATPKAMSVAYRTYLLQLLCLPTDEPDPDSYSAEAVPETADQARARLLGLCEKRNVDPKWIGSTFRERVGDDLNTTTDVAALQALIAWVERETTNTNRREA